MATAQITPIPARCKGQSAQVSGWRHDQLRRAGYEPQLAALIAERCDVDLHAATELIESGCPPELALRIL